MYLFSRQMVLQGDPRASMDWAMQMRALVSSKTGHEVSLWAAIVGAPVGTVRAVVRTETRAELADAFGPLQFDPEYLEREAKGQAYLAGAPAQELVEVMHMAGGLAARPAVGAVASLISTEILPGRYMGAFTWGIEAAELVAEITGLAVSFQRNVAGSFGGIHWLQTAPDTAAMEQGEQRLMADDRYLAKLEEIGELFMAGSGVRVLATRVA